MSPKPQAPPLEGLMELVTGKWVSKAIGTAAELAIPDAMASGARTSAEIAEKVNASEDAVYRLLRGLSTVGVVREDGGRAFTLTELGDLLRTDSPFSMRDYARFMTYPTSWDPWGRFEHSVRTGKPAFDEVFGVPTFEYFATHPEEARIFDGAMTSVSRLDSVAVAASYDFSSFETIVDVAGGYGLLLATALRSAPKSRGILFEMPHVLEGAKELLGREGVLDRCELVAGSFFESVPPGGDAYMMKHILHDWDDARSRQILERCHAVMCADARLLVLDAVIPGPNEPHVAKLLDLEMLALTPEGKERTESEFRALFESAGFRLTRIVPTPAPVSVVEGVKG